MRNILFALLTISFLQLGFASSSSSSAPVTAWTKLVQLDTGGYANYWVESFLHYDIQHGQVILQVDGYVSKAAYQSHLASVKSIPYTLPDDINPALRDGGKRFLSAYVLAQPMFSGATPDQ